jgi:hypothetical protein
MKHRTNEEFAKMVLESASPEHPFRPKATYDPDGDCIEFMIKPDNFYAHRIDELFTVYYSEKTNEVVGSLIKSVKSFCKKLIQQSPWFAIIVDEPPIWLSHLFVARLMQLQSKPDQAELRLITTYKELIKQAQAENIEIPNEACIV